MSRHVLLSSFLVYPRLPRSKVREVAGALVHRLFIDQPVPEEKWVEPVDEAQVLLGYKPPGQVVKLARREHVDAFFDRGTLLLGTFKGFQKHENPEVGDAAEASFLLVGESPTRTAFAELSSGFDQHVFCCTLADDLRGLSSRFGYDDGFVIDDVNAFSRAVAKALGVADASHGACVYSRHKVVLGRVSDGFNFQMMSGHLAHLVKKAKYFVKPLRFVDQKEYRFLWGSPADVEPRLLDVPEAAAFCRRLPAGF